VDVAFLQRALTAVHLPQRTAATRKPTSSAASAGNRS
jgi:hypothetical protein